MAIVIFIGLILTIILLFPQKAWVPSGIVTNLSFKLKDSKLTTNHWLAGAVLFVMNGLLFAIAFTTIFLIPFGMGVGLLLCIPLSIFMWYLFSEIWQGTYKNKIKSACMGCTFFLVFIGCVVWKYSTLEPAYPGDDLFMAWIGTLIAIIGSVGALFVSLLIMLRNK